MEQLKFIGKRLVYLVVMLFGVATLVFILTKMIPGDPTVANLSQRALNDPEIVAAYRAKYGLDQPLPVQYILYMKNLLQFDLGTSMRTNKPVLSELARCYPATIELALFAIVIAAILGVLFGIISAIRRNSILDQTVRAISVTGVSIPSFWFALLVLYFFYYKLKLFPGPGRLSNAFTAPATVTGMYVIDSLLKYPQGTGRCQPSDSSGNRACGLYHGTDYQDSPLQSSGRYVYRLYPYGKGQGPVKAGTDYPPRPGKRPDSCAHCHRSGPGQPVRRHGAGGNHFQLAGCGAVCL